MISTHYPETEISAYMNIGTWAKGGIYTSNHLQCKKLKDDVVWNLSLQNSYLFLSSMVVLQASMLSTLGKAFTVSGTYHLHTRVTNIMDSKIYIYVFTIKYTNRSSIKS